MVYHSPSYGKVIERKREHVWLGNMRVVVKLLSEEKKNRRP